MTEPNVSQTLIAIDAGTTGVTCILFDAELAPIARAYREFAQGFPRPGWVEHEASAILGALDEVLAEILAHPQAGEVAALGVTNQRETIFAIDAVDGTPLGPGIVWQDRRTADRCAALRAGGHEPLVRERTGLVLDPYFSASKIQWMLEQDHELRDRAEQGGVRFCTVDALVVEHLTGGEVCATDPTNAARTMLYDIEAQDWSEELLELFGVEREWLPEVRPSRGDFGVTDAGRFGRAIPVRGVAGDQQAALFGQGCWEPGELKTTYGTGCFLLMNSGTQRSDVSGLLTTLALDAGGAPCFAIEGSVFVGGALIQWLRDELRFFADAAESEALAASVEDSGGVHVVPAFTGLGAPYWDADARGAILGLSRGTGRAQITLAALEAIAFQTTELIELLRDETGHAVETLLADGGATANDLLMAIQADLAGAEVRRASFPEATARGAAALAGLGIGLWEDLRGLKLLRERGQLFEPRLGQTDRSARLEDWRRAVVRVRS
jgi:glycerol kinase